MNKKNSGCLARNSDLCTEQSRGPNAKFHEVYLVSPNVFSNFAVLGVNVFDIALRQNIKKAFAALDSDILILRYFQSLSE